MVKLTHNYEEQRYTLHLENGKEAYVNYSLESEMMRLTYSYVPTELRGDGVGKELVEKTFEMLTEEGFKAEAVCSYIQAVAHRHNKWSTIID